ncbi:hypothetical protein [Lacimicrobium alkaliphilum]|uniref:Outer membrane protein beta-barrel domain-containing protein n=1 Tax=Lacimicrobium alkaliphilum TaxID=1526571 RepID=A0ABQ1RA98_9ALTE|nr:hypothetical protein [Lacimicrobium alkaliphilum]GGD62002.1 hypothetical protein GCM10011357_16630 [Lacimicrobium alkaliphilum]
MKKIAFLILLSVVSSTNTFASDTIRFETGIGVDFGGIGAQFHMPIGTNKLDLYLSAGLFYTSNRSNEEMGFGAGGNYFMDKKQAITFYYGTLHTERYIDEFLDVRTDSDQGLSVGYKYYFSGSSASGWSLGANYNFYDGGSYPFLSVGYRY